MTLRDEIVYENLESREMTWVKFMGYNLNLNRDKINGFGPELDSNEGGHVARRGPHIQLKLSWDKRGIRAKRAHFSYWFTRERERERERRAKLPSKIYGVQWVGFRRAKNKSSSHQREVRVGT